MPEKDGDASQRPSFELFRGSEARDYVDHDCMALDDITPTIAQGLTAFSEAGASRGQQVEMVYSRPGMSLSRVWFKSGYPLPLHAHNSDCVYFILAGSVTVGSDTLEPGDGFFVGKEVPYTYTPGPEGVEVLEFRDTDDFNIHFMAKTEKAWQKTVEQVAKMKHKWATETRPSVRVSEAG